MHKPTIFLTLKDNGQDVSVNAGDVLSISFSECANGYSWKCVEGCSTCVGNFYGHDPLNRYNLNQYGNVHHLYFKADNIIIKLENNNPNTPSQPVADRFEIRLIMS